jgi:hypothetical protein
MPALTLRLLLVATAPVLASFVILALGSVGKSVWIIHLLAIGLACAMTVAGGVLKWQGNPSLVALVIIVLTLLAIAAPLLRALPGPSRWVVIGPFSLYVAPLLLPAFFAACAVYIGKGGRSGLIACLAGASVSVLLAVQPDVSQVLALLAGLAIIFLRYRASAFMAVTTLCVVALAAVWAFSKPDPLRPVPYVEGVFTLALAHSMFTGLVVIASALILLLGLFVSAVKGHAWLLAVAVYYAVLFACSALGWTPAPLIGYGAAPILGFGLMAALSQRLSAQHCPIFHKPRSLDENA